MAAGLNARVSSKDQEREGFSIPAQFKLLKQYAREQYLMIVCEFVAVETAKQSGRGAFGEMIAALKADPSCRTISRREGRSRLSEHQGLDDGRRSGRHHSFRQGNVVVSKDLRSSDKFLHGIKVLMAKNYVDNLRVGNTRALFASDALTPR